MEDSESGDISVWYNGVFKAVEWPSCYDLLRLSLDWLRSDLYLLGWAATVAKGEEESGRCLDG